ncbi:2861_t:CDS:1 [Funneliformis caledonium]|uniref:2861_t:CDS:1 n=1 Tax=Funneliformis caledonium TaxID=1117310 RepID=A0A9N9HJG3_9GLOM|nr:2861_t:CDS:1 [Funneliformis caledonium]
MPEIRLNCLVVPDNIPVREITRQNLVTIDIGINESVHSLRSKIKKECASCFDDIPITEFVIRAVEILSNDLVNDNITTLFLSIKNGTQGTELSPISNISPRFSTQLSQDNIHIIVYLKIKTPQQ